jgi:hypothetical protein
MTNFVQEAYKLHLIGDAMGARLFYMAELEVDSKSAPALMNLSQLAMDEGNHVVAEVLTLKALAVDPHSTVLWGNLGMLYAQMERFEESNSAIQKALELGPELTSNWRNAGLLRIRERKYSEAVECFKKVIALGDDGHGVRNDLAHAYLALGELHKALELYESRWAILHHQIPWDFHIKEWQGQDLNGESILIHAEQGFGDTIMTMRFIKVLEEKYPECEVTFCVPAELVTLCNHVGHYTYSFDEMYKFADTYDYHTPLMSMVRWLELEVGDIDSTPYIHLTDSTVKNMMRVGICWASGRRNSDHDWRGRYSDLRDWLHFAVIPNVHLVSLQQGQDAADVEKIGAGALISEREIFGCHDWLDTAKVVASLDVVVTVDTAIAHLAGAMGKPVIMLSQYSNCWRWWDIKAGVGTPWYDRMYIVQQEKPKDWNGCLDRAFYLLESMVR